MKRVPAEEFASHAAEYLEGTEEISIEKDGAVIGRYVPLLNGHSPNGTRTPSVRRTISPEAQARLDRLNRTWEAIYAKTGLTEDDFLAESESYPSGDDSRS
jgi:hypothetical protein